MINYIRLHSSGIFIIYMYDVPPINRTFLCKYVYNNLKYYFSHNIVYNINMCNGSV